MPELLPENVGALTATGCPAPFSPSPPLLPHTAVKFLQNAECENPGN